ncbi:MAG TPA: hypothetical protein VFH58_03235 [Acidimicrobiales bacterium]|nr:hypothetical protein [Acidimicrobiales bacterium]
MPAGQVQQRAGGADAVAAPQSEPSAQARVTELESGSGAPGARPAAVQASSTAAGGPDG